MVTIGRHTADCDGKDCDAQFASKKGQSNVTFRSDLFKAGWWLYEDTCFCPNCVIEAVSTEKKIQDKSQEQDKHE